jgi:O-methyltransferase
MPLKRIARSVVRRVRGDVRHPDASEFLQTLSTADRDLITEARPYSLISLQRFVANIDAVEYVVRRDVPGAIAECGVWRGGSILVMIRVLQRLGQTDRDIYLYDTFEGMTIPGDADTSVFDGAALDAWKDAQAEGRKAWDYLFRDEIFSLDQVKDLIYGTGYPPERIHFVVGRVEDTIPNDAPETIAVLRLDTDWYDSTKHELVHLFPRIEPGGVLIVDDYGHWDGCRRAVDEYFATESAPVLLSRTDYTGRVAIKH